MNPSERKSILFVDDEEDLLDIVHEYFTVKGYRVITARNGYEALDILKNRNERVDCCFTDINMPEMDGLVLAEHIRMIDNTLPVVVMTGYPSIDNTIKTLQNGVVDFLIKPVNLSQMELCLRSVLRDRQVLIDNILLKQEVEKRKELEAVNSELKIKVEELKTLKTIMEDFTTIRKSFDVFKRLVEKALEISKGFESRFYVVNDLIREPFEVTSAFSGLEGPGIGAPRLDGFSAVRSAEGAQAAVLKVIQGEKKEPLVISGGEDLKGFPKGTKTFLALPLSIREKPFGVLTACLGGNGSRFSAQTLYYLSFMNQRAAYAIENLALYENIYENLLCTLGALVQAIEVRDHYTKEHSRQVTGIAVTIARAMGLGSEELDILEVAGPLHDIGKIGVQDKILLKPGKLTAEEYEEIKKHPAIGGDIVGRLGLWERERQVIRHHHERYDGAGYPDRLAGAEIPLLARIITVADVYDAMISDRVYRRKMSEAHVLQAIQQGSGVYFDPEIVKVFLHLHTMDRLFSR